MKALTFTFAHQQAFAGLLEMAGEYSRLETELSCLKEGKAKVEKQINQAHGTLRSFLPSEILNLTKVVREVRSALEEAEFSQLALTACSSAMSVRKGVAIADIQRGIRNGINLLQGLIEANITPADFSEAASSLNDLFTIEPISARAIALVKIAQELGCHLPKASSAKGEVVFES